MSQGSPRDDIQVEQSKVGRRAKLLLDQLILETDARRI